MSDNVQAFEKKLVSSPELQQKLGRLFASFQQAPGGAIETLIGAIVHEVADAGVRLTTDEARAFAGVVLARGAGQELDAEDLESVTGGAVQYTMFTPTGEPVRLVRSAISGIEHEDTWDSNV